MAVVETLQEPLLQPMEYSVRSYQHDQVDSLSNILLKYGFACDKSEMGTGKTYVIGALARKLNLPVFVVGQVVTISKWYHVCKMAKVDVVSNISYQSLRGRGGYKLRHQYLTRHDENRYSASDNMMFKPTQTLIDLVESGILLVFDEFDALKNNTLQRDAAFSLVHTIRNSVSQKSKVVFLSATPWDDPKGKQFWNFMHLVGISNSRYNTNADEKQLVEWCKKIDVKKTETIIEQKDLIYYDLFVKVVLPEISTTMPCLTLDVNKYAMNGFYNILDRQGQLDLHDGVEELSRIAGQQHIGTNTYTEIKNIYMKIEIAKVKTLIRLGEQKLKSEPNCKIIYCCYYKESQYRLARYFIEHWGDQCCDILNGDTKRKDRDTIIEAFNTDPTLRVLVLNQKVGGKGIDLHDTIGDSPRYMFGVPRHEIIDQHQVTGRIYREGTKSDATIIWVYGKNVPEELRIISSLSKKCKILHDTLEVQVASGIKYPGDYDSYYEPDIVVNDDNNADDIVQ